MRAYQKKFELSRSNGSWDMGSGKFKIWKTKNLGFFEKWPPGPPQKGKKTKKGYFWSLGTQMAYQKNFRQFSGRGVEKYVAAHWMAPSVISKLPHNFKFSSPAVLSFQNCLYHNFNPYVASWFSLLVPQVSNEVRTRPRSLVLQKVEQDKHTHQKMRDARNQELENDRFIN